MKKKIFTLLTLLLAVCSGAWAQTWWKASSSTAVTASATYVDDDVLTVTTVFEGTKGSTYSKTFSDSQVFPYAIQIRVNDAPSAGTPTGTENAGNTPLVIVAKKNATIKFYYRRQANSGSFVSNDGKDMKLVDQSAPTTALVAESFVKDGSATDFDWFTKEYKLTKGHTYTLWAKGTTVNLNGFVYDGGAKTSTTKNTEKSNQHAYLDNAGSISGTPTVLSFTDYPMTVEGANIQAGNAQYQFVVNSTNYTGVKFAANETYIIKPANGVTITGVNAYGSSNSSSTAGISSGSNSIVLAARGDKNSPVTMTPLALTTNGEGFYYFTITGKQSIIVLEVTYDIVENVDVKISDVKYATLYYDKKLIIPSGVRAFVGELSGSTLTMHEVTDAIPANTGVILYGNAGTYNFATTTADVEAVAGNSLTGTTTEISTPADAYTLGQDGEGNVGMRSYSGAKIRAYSAYLVVPSTARTISMVFDSETSGIEAAGNEKDVATKKYIKNGRMVIETAKGIFTIAGMPVK